MNELKPWKTLLDETVFSASPFVKVHKQRVLLPQNREINDFYQVHLRPFSISVSIMKDGSVMMIRQYKHGLGGVSLTFPAGFVEEGEDPRAACKRELLEETGLVPASMVHLAELIDNGNQRGCVGNYYLCLDCEQVAEPASGDLEEMHLERKSVPEVDAAIWRGEIRITHHAAAWSLARLRGW